MLADLSVENILFIDIETVPVQKEFADLDPVMQELWDKKSAYFRNQEQTAADAFQRAGIFAEFGKIVCISAGVIFTKNDERFFRVKSFYGHDENLLLVNFGQLLSSFCNNPRKRLCGHNIKEFDIPFVARRMIINGVQLPTVLHIAGKKPWEVQFIDTLELWKFGDYKHYTSLKLLTHIMDIPSSKDDIDGNQVADVYYIENNIERIAIYCEKDVFVTAQLLLRMKGETLIKQENIERIEK